MNSSCVHSPEHSIITLSRVPPRGESARSPSFCGTLILWTSTIELVIKTTISYSSINRASLLTNEHHETCHPTDNHGSFNLYVTLTMKWLCTNWFFSVVPVGTNLKHRILKFVGELLMSPVALQPLSHLYKLRVHHQKNSQHKKS